MYRSRLTLALLCAGALASGCATDSPTSAGDRTASDPAPLVNAPLLTQDDVTPSTIVVQEGDGPEAGPAGVAFGGGDLPDMSGMAQIFDPDTRISFEPGFVGAFGRHDYGGNVGRISTALNVSYSDQHVGSQSAHRQNTVPFLADWGRRKTIWVYPKVYTDHTCGLRASAESDHAAWWEFFQGNDVQAWGRAEVSTFAQPASQGPCSPGGTGGYESDRKRSGGAVCTYWITYDVNTGVILAADLLYCTSGSGGLM